MIALIILDTVFPAVMFGWLVSQVLGLVTAKWLAPPHFAPRIRQNRVLLVALSAVLLPVAMMLAILAATMFHSADWMASHCGTHSHDHIHACFSSGSRGSIPVWHMGLAMLVMVIGISSVLVTLLTELRLQRRLKSLFLLAGGQGRLRRLHDSRVVALAVGGKEPAVFLSSGLLEKLSAQQRRIVMAHEGAHLRHGDPWRNRLVNLLLALFIPVLAKRLGAIWENAIEEAADDAVLRKFNRFDLAETLVRVLSLRLFDANGAQAMHSGDVEARIQRLIGPAQPVPSARPGLFEWTCLAALPALPVTFFVQHHAIETFLMSFGGA